MLSRSALCAAVALLAMSVTPLKAADGVVASIKPVHSLVAAVMKGVGEPGLIVKGAASPHVYSMRPSDAALLQEARLVFWIGPGLEVFLETPLESLAENARIVTLSKTPELTLLPFREDGAFEAHDHGDEGGHEDHAKDAHDGHDGNDMHLWLDPENARKMVEEIAEVLSEVDPDNAARYATNTEDTIARLDELTAEINARLAPVRSRPFIVFHDAYHYFENRFGVEAAGSVTVSPEIMPGAGRIADIRARIADLGAVCVFAEPQFEPRIIEVLTEGGEVRSATLDPLGAGIQDGPELYFRLLENMADALGDCLGGPG